MLEASQRKASNVSFVFVDDDTLASMNRQYLNHNTYTDILTFDLSEDATMLSADIYISIDRVRANAERLKQNFRDELHRVMAHGILHLLGHRDKTPGEKAAMRRQEDYWLNLRSF